MKHYPKKKIFTVNLNMEDITDADYAHIWGNIMICMFKVIHYCYPMYLRTLEICVLTCTT